MIDFAPSDELELLRGTARAFASEQLAPQMRRFERDRGVSEEVRALFRATGLAAADWPQAIGGAGLGSLARVLVLEELGVADPGAAIALDPLGSAGHALMELGGETVMREVAAPLAARPGARAVLVRDASGRLSARDGRLRGEVAWVPADRIDLLVVLGADHARLVEGGFRRTELRGAGLRAAGASAIDLAGAVARARFDGATGAARALARARLDTAALLVGVMRAAAEYSRAYAMERTAFGRPIAHHQGLAFLIADMASAVDGARLLVWHAAWRLDRRDEPGLVCEAAATAFVEAAEQALFVTQNAVQILGGHGFMQDHPVEKFMREARALSLLLGGIDAARGDAGDALAAAADAGGVEP